MPQMRQVQYNGNAVEFFINGMTAPMMGNEV